MLVFEVELKIVIFKSERSFILCVAALSFSHVDYHFRKEDIIAEASMVMKSLYTRYHLI